MDWGLLIVWVAFIGALWRASVWRVRFQRERAQHRACHQVFDAIMDELVGANGNEQSQARVMWINPEAVKGESGHD